VSSRDSTRDSAYRAYGRMTHRAAENAYRVELKEQISDRFEYLLGEADERAYRLRRAMTPLSTAEQRVPAAARLIYLSL
jgi:muramoyltetrapeptide carboxypeptidase LdcA involved in peptidoglycan recycling